MNGASSPDKSETTPSQAYQIAQWRQSGLKRTLFNGPPYLN